MTTPDTTTGRSPLTQRRTEVAQAVAIYLVSGDVPVHPINRWIAAELGHLAAAVRIHAQRPDTPLQPAVLAGCLVALMRSEISDPVCDWLADGFSIPRYWCARWLSWHRKTWSPSRCSLLAWCELRDGNPAAADQALARFRAARGNGWDPPAGIGVAFPTGPHDEGRAHHDQGDHDQHPDAEEGDAGDGAVRGPDDQHSCYCPVGR